METCCITLALMALAVTLLLHYIFHNWNYWKNLGIPYVKPTPFFGNIKDTILGKRNLCFILDDIYKSHPNDKYVGYFQFTTPHLLIKDPELIGHILVNDFQNFHSRGVSIDESVDPLAGHLVHLDGARWKMVRNKFAPTFSSAKLKLMFNLVEECVKDLCDHLEQYAETGKAAEMKETMAKFTTDVIGRCAFGLDFNSLKDPNSEYRKFGEKVFNPTARSTLSFIKNVLGMINPHILHRLKIRELPDEITNFFTNLMDRTIEYRKVNNINRNDFMQLMINIYDQEMLNLEKNGNVKHEGKTTEAGSFTYNLLAANMFIFYVAGFETTATTLTFLLYELALNPEIQKKLRDEIEKIVEYNNGIIDYDMLNKLVYMDMVINETLRKYDPALFNGRVSEKPYTIPGTSHVIPAGTKVSIPIYSLHHDPKYYPEPEKFIPERFTVDAVNSRPAYCYQPFGDGPRICIGLRFAKLEMKACLATIIPKYQFSTCKETITPVSIKPRAFLFSPSHDIHVSVTKLK